MEKFLDKSDVLLESDTKKAEFVAQIVKNEKVKVDLLLKQPMLINDLVENQPELLAETLLEKADKDELEELDENLQEALEVRTSISVRN